MQSFDSLLISIVHSYNASPKLYFFCLAFDNNSIRYLTRAPIIILHYTYIASKRSKNEGWIYA